MPSGSSASTTSRQVRVELEPTPDAPAEARRALRELPLGALADDTLLLATELVSNAVRHAGLEAGDRFVLEAEAGPSGVHVEVRDPGRRFQRIGRHGYGLQVVSRAADRWGVEQDGGTRAWFELDAAAMGRGGFEPPSDGL